MATTPPTPPDIIEPQSPPESPPDGSPIEQPVQPDPFYDPGGGDIVEPGRGPDEAPPV